MNTHNTHIRMYTYKKFLHLENHIKAIFLFQKSSKEQSLPGANSLLPKKQVDRKKKATPQASRKFQLDRLLCILTTYKLAFFPQPLCHKAAPELRYKA